MGRIIESPFEVTKLIPNQRIEFETITSTFPIQIMREVLAVDDGTEIHAIINGQPSGLMRLFLPFITPMMSR